MNRFENMLLACALLASPAVAASPVAKIGDWHGAPAIIVDGKPLPPMSVTILRSMNDRADEVAYYRHLGDAGVRLFYLYAWTNWREPGTGKSDKALWNPSKNLNGVEMTRERIRRILEGVPNAYVIIRLTVAPPLDWVNAHPEEMVRFSDGKPRKARCTTVSLTENADGMHSLCSEKWRAEGMKAIEEYYDALDATPEGTCVIGTFVAAGGTSEWYYPTCLRQLDGAYGDFSEPFRREYERYLRATYGTEEKLRAAWNDPTATFAKPRIATFDECGSLGDIELIREIGVKTGRMTPERAKQRTCGKTTYGEFLDIRNYRHVADMYDAWSEGTARTIVHFARGLKKIRPNRLVGAFFGATAQTSYYDFATATGVKVIAESGVVDFLAAPSTYKNRQLGGCSAGREFADSLRLHNMLFVSEDDVRTHNVLSPVVREQGDLHTPMASVNILKRDFARNLCEDTHGWWFDMGHEKDAKDWWYNDPAIFAVIGEQQRIAAEAFAGDRTRHNDVALVCDYGSMHLVPDAVTADILDYWRVTDLARLGMGTAWHSLDDFAQPKMPAYKLYVMLNCYDVSDAERSAVYAKARKDGATVVWLYGAGFANRAAADPISAANVSKTVGMTVRCEEKKSEPFFTLEKGPSPWLAHAARDHRYGNLSRRLHPTEAQVADRRPPQVNPTFWIDDPKATVLGRYAADGRVALAAREVDGVKVVYSAAPLFEAELLGSIAEHAGCHRYSRRGDVLYANGRYLAVHADGGGLRTLRLPRRCTPFEVYEKRAYGENVDAFEVLLEHGETKTWELR